MISGQWCRTGGKYVSEMPQEMAEEEGSDDLDDVEKFLNEDDESDYVLEEDEIREVLALAWKHKRQEISWKTVETDVSSCDA